MAVDIRSLACSYARNGNVSIVSAAPKEDDHHRAGSVTAYVVGQSRRYQVTLGKRGWSCTCEEAGCAHAAAVALVTGHDELARRPGEPR